MSVQETKNIFFFLGRFGVDCPDSFKLNEWTLLGYFETSWISWRLSSLLLDCVCLSHLFARFWQSAMNTKASVGQKEGIFPSIFEDHEEDSLNKPRNTKCAESSGSRRAVDDCPGRSMAICSTATEALRAPFSHLYLRKKNNFWTIFFFLKEMWSTSFV